MSIIARACAIFKINQIFIYKDKNGNENDSMLLSTLLKYLATPPYFRRQLFRKTQLLNYSGALQPLNISNHLVTSNQKLINPRPFPCGLVLDCQIIFQNKIKS